MPSLDASTEGLDCDKMFAMTNFLALTFSGVFGGFPYFVGFLLVGIVVVTLIDFVTNSLREAQDRGCWLLQPVKKKWLFVFHPGVALIAILLVVLVLTHTLT